MRRDHDVVEPEQRAVDRGLDREHVERRTAQMAGLDRLHQGVLVHDPAARRVDQPRAGFHQRELVSPDQLFGLRGPRQVDRDEVGLDQQRLERRHHVHTDLFRAIGRHVGVERDQPHPERGGPGRHERPDSAEADEPEGLPRELDALPLSSLPLSSPQRCVGLWHVPRLREEQSQRVLGGRDHVGLGRVDHHDAAARGGIDVHVVQTDPRACHHP